MGGWPGGEAGLKAFVAEVRMRSAQLLAVLCCWWWGGARGSRQRARLAWSSADPSCSHHHAWLLPQGRGQAWQAPYEPCGWVSATCVAEEAVWQGARRPGTVDTLNRSTWGRFCSVDSNRAEFSGACLPHPQAEKEKAAKKEGPYPASPLRPPARNAARPTKQVGKDPQYVGFAKE